MADPTKWLAYLMEYEPPGLVLTKPGIEKMMNEAHFCVYAPAGWPIGAEVTLVEDMLHGEGPRPKVGSRVRCVAHKYNGKVAVLEDVTS